jgi:hypothetical protein
MQIAMRRPSVWRRNTPVLTLAFCATLIVYGLPAHGQQASPPNNPTALDPGSQDTKPARSESGRSSGTAASPQCALLEHWDPSMGMCMAGAAKAKHVETSLPSPGGTVTPAASTPSPSDGSMDSTMNMSSGGATKSKATLMLHINQFMVGSSTSGPRGQSRLTGPGSWMLTYDNDLTSSNHLSINVMGSPEQLTVGSKGTPQIFQTDHIDNFHAHDTIMAVEFRDTVTFSDVGKQRVTLLFAPRGEAAVGPVPFMHRESAEGNPDAPLGHALQDGFHDVSTVLGMEYQIAHTTAEITAFSGATITWPLPLHGPDSYAVRLSQDVSDHVRMGASYADVLLPDDAGGAEHNQFISGWLTTSHQIRGGSLKSAFVWGSARTAGGPFLNSFLEEAVYQRGRNNFYGRAEALQLTPSQLALVTNDGAEDARWVEAFTVGYERMLFEKRELFLFVGGSCTKDIARAAFQPSYGSDPHGVKIYLRIKFMQSGAVL